MNLLIHLIYTQQNITKNRMVELDKINLKYGLKELLMH